MADKKTSKTMWETTKFVGILLVIIGIFVIIYSAYLWSSFKARAIPYAIGAYRSGFNQSGFNQSGSNYTIARARLGTSFISPYFGGFVIGILLILLGLVTFKYAKLNIAIASKR